MSVNWTVPSPAGTDGLEKVNVGLLSTSTIRPARAGRVDWLILQDAEVGGVGDDPHELDRHDPVGGVRAVADRVFDVDRAGGCRAGQGVGEGPH